jgi:hypothetical protein
MVLSVMRLGNEGDGIWPIKLSQPRKVVAMQEMNDVIDFAGSMFERLPQQKYAMALLVVLWCGIGLVVVVVSWNRSTRLKNQLDELSRDVRQQQLILEETRRIFDQFII